MGISDTMDIVFVILNYNIVDETMDCVNSICENIDTKEFHIVVVDNKSKDAVGEKLKTMLQGNNKVTLILNEENLGFARGNNVGIARAREYQPKFICCLNNDTLLEQKDFFEKLQGVYENGKPAVIGPNILLKNGDIFHMHKKLLSVAYYENKILGKETAMQKVKKILIKNPIIYAINQKKNYVQGESKEADDVLLHGCCLIFTETFFEKLEGFDSRTFLYGEEELLYVSLKKNGLLSRFTPQLEIRHLEDVSTNSIMEKKQKKSDFTKKYSAESLKILVNELKQYGEVIYRESTK